MIKNNAFTNVNYLTFLAGLNEHSIAIRDLMYSNNWEINYFWFFEEENHLKNLTKSQFDFERLNFVVFNNKCMHK